MRKHFLILMLLTLLPLAGWADEGNLSEYSIKLGAANKERLAYTSANLAPTISLVTKDGFGHPAIEQTANGQKFTYAWTDSNGNPVADDAVINVGKYTVTVTPNDFDTFGEPISRNFWITKGELTVDASEATISAGGNWTSAGYVIVTNAPALKLNGVAFAGATIEYMTTSTDNAPLADATGWKAIDALAKAKNAGTYYVWYKVDGDDNYTAVGPTKLGTFFTINGESIDGHFEAPQALATPTFGYDGEEHELVQAGSVEEGYGEMKYSIDGGTTWSKDVPKGKNVDTYTIQWMIEPTNQYAGHPTNAGENLTATITQVAATISTAAVKADGTPEYTAKAQKLLKTAAVVNYHATVTYTIGYKATSGGEYVYDDVHEFTNIDDVVATDAGYYSVKQFVKVDDNFSASNTKYTEIQIKKAKLYVTVDDADKVYGAPDPDYDITYSGWKENEWHEAATGKVLAADFVAPTIKRDKYDEKAGQKVGTYKIKAITNGSAKNYEFDFTDETHNVFGYLTINKKPLKATDFTVTTASLAGIVYNGTAKTPGLTSVVYSKYNGTDAVNVDNLATESATMATPTDYAYTYEKNTDAGTAEIIITGQGNFEGSIVIPFTIAKADIYVMPVAAEKNYGNDDPEATAIAFDAENPATVYQYKLVTAGNVEVAGAKLNGTVELQREEGEAVSTYKIYFKSYEPNPSDNYTVKNDVSDNQFNVEVTAERYANFTIKKASTGLKLRFTTAGAAKNTKVYGNADPVWTIDDLEPIAAGEEGGFVGDDTWASVKPTLSAPIFTLASQNVENEEQNHVIVSNLASTNYPSVSVEPLEFNVTKRKVAVKVKAQTITYGNNITTTSPSDDVWEIDNTNSEGGDWNGTTGDTRENLAVTLSVANLPTYGPSATAYEKVITASTGNPNYVIDDKKSVWGNLTVNPGTALVLDDAEDDNFIKIKANNGKELNVTIKFNRDQKLKDSDPESATRKWTKGYWNSLVLPFDISIAELSSGFGYAIFNVADPVNTTTGKVAFKIELAENTTGNVIPANTPILVKSNTDFFGPHTINFGSRTIVAPEAAQFGEPINATNYRFMGTYEALTASKDNMANDYYFWTGVTNTPSRINTVKTPDTQNSWTILPFSCYVDQTGTATSGGARELEFTYEDLGGHTTTVRGISIDEIGGENAEGIYNLNGVKMQNIPTQKGIYIMNGKKVVVK